MRLLSERLNQQSTSPSGGTGDENSWPTLEDGSGGADAATPSSSSELASTHPATTAPAQPQTDVLVAIDDEPKEGKSSEGQSEAQTV